MWWQRDFAGQSDLRPAPKTRPHVAVPTCEATHCAPAEQASVQTATGKGLFLRLIVTPTFIVPMTTVRGQQSGQALPVAHLCNILVTRDQTASDDTHWCAHLPVAARVV